MQEILGTVRRGIIDFGMIEAGDKVAVGLSGGKDSMLLLEALYRLRKFMGITFDIMAITIDPCFNNRQTDYSIIEKFCSDRGIEYLIERTEIASVIFDIRKEKNPCSLCARMRRGIIHGLCKENGCNKLALGHHMDDAVETFMMNLFYEGRIGTFQPVTYLSRRDLTMIRPLIYLGERRVINAVAREGIPVVKSLCPVDGATTREKTKDWLGGMEDSGVDRIREKVFGAIKESNLKGWRDRSGKDTTKEDF